MAVRGLSVLLLAACLGLAVDGFYLPGIAPVNYEEGSTVDVFADRLTSARDQLPYEYFSLPFCRSHKETLRQQNLNLGEILLGERDQLTDYKMLMMVNENCKIYCQGRFTADEIKMFAKRIRDNYYVRLNVDNMPAVMAVRDKKEVFHVIGAPLGKIDDGTVFIFNHLSFKVKVHEASPSVADISSFGTSDMYRVVGLEVQPRSVRHVLNEEGDELMTCGMENSTVVPMALDESDPAGHEIIFTYDVNFVKDPILEWATRWDPLLKANAESVSLQKYYIINSLSITIFLTVLVGMILTRTVYLDYARYNSFDSTEELEAESGWKQVHGDVFRAPEHKEFLSICVGNGVQITVIVIITLSFALLGFWSPAYRGGLLTALIFLWVLTSFLSGFVSASLYGEIGGTNRKVVTLGAAFFFSGLMFLVFFAVNCVLSFAGSSAAVRFFTLLVLLFFWLVVSVPLSVFGSFIGYKQRVAETPCKTNPLPREIPEYAPVSPYFFCIVSGVMPFGVVFVELAFILDSLWQKNIYFMFGFLFAVFILLVVTCVEVSLVISYLILSQEDYRWWWTSFLSSGSSGLYVLLYSLFYLFSQRSLREGHLASIFLFICYSLLIAEGFALMAGALGFLSSRLFVRRMFSAIRVD